MNASETLALTKAVSTKAAKSARSELTAGTYTVDFTVRVCGSLDIAEDGTRTPTVSLSPLMLAALAIKGRGATDDCFKAKLTELMREAVDAANNPSAETAKLVAWVKEAMDDVKGELAKLPKAPVKGRVTPALDVKVIGAETPVKKRTGRLRKAKYNPKQTELV